MSKSQNETYLRIGVAGLLALAIAAATVAWAGNDTYTYDAHGRLLTVTYADGSTISYTYDDAGNRTALAQSAAP